MLHKTRGIVLNIIKFRESSIIAKVFTEAFGTRSYLVNSIRSSKGRQRMALFQPCTCLEMVVYDKPGRDIHRISEFKCEYIFQTIQIDPSKSGIILFLSEVLYKVLREDGPHPEMFSFIHTSFQVLDHTISDYSHFHHQFLLKLSKFLGFDPVSAHEIFQQLHFLSNDEKLAKQEKYLIDEMLSGQYGMPLSMPAHIRRQLLELIIDYYRLHVEGLGDIKSMKVLREVLS